MDPLQCGSCSLRVLRLRAVVAFPRLFAACAAVLVLTASLAQVGCGVFHCVETVASNDERAVPPCHRASHDEEAGRTSHAPGGGDEECCQVLPLEPPSAPVHGVVAAPSIAVVGTLQASFVLSSRVAVTARAIDTGPPSPRGAGRLIPLRI